MILQQLFSEPALFIAWLVAIIIALSVHEFSHALAGYKLGDETAKNYGRLTLNPMAHLSGVGLFMLLIAGFGWGKPVPFNPLNLKNRRFGPALIALAGPISNLAMAIFGSLILKILLVLNVFLAPEKNLLIIFLAVFILINLMLLVFNLLPIPPLDGSKILYSFLHAPKYQKFIYNYEKNGPLILIGLLILDNVSNLNLFGYLYYGLTILFDSVFPGLLGKIF
jgi:Zn-dependent protease